MKINTILSGDNYLYVLSNGGHSVLVDAGYVKPVVDFLSSENLLLDAILLTHNHGDHTSGSVELKRIYGCTVHGPAGGNADVPVKDNETLEYAGITIRIIETPGHTTNDVCYFLPEQRVVFTGDTMFACGCGRLFGGTVELMRRSLNRIVSLGDDVLMYCGHEYTEENLRFALTVEPDNQAIIKRLDDIRLLLADGKTTVPSEIGLEKLTNPFLRVSEPSLKASSGMENADEDRVFAVLRKRKDLF